MNVQHIKNTGCINFDTARICDGGLILRYVGLGLFRFGVKGCYVVVALSEDLFHEVHHIFLGD